MYVVGASLQTLSSHLPLFHLQDLAPDVARLPEKNVIIFKIPIQRVSVIYAVHDEGFTQLVPSVVHWIDMV